MEVYTIDITLNLLLLHVVLTHVITHNSKSIDSFTVKLLFTNQWWSQDLTPGGQNLYILCMYIETHTYYIYVG